MQGKVTQNKVFIFPTLGCTKFSEKNFYKFQITATTERNLAMTGRLPCTPPVVIPKIRAFLIYRK